MPRIGLIGIIQGGWAQLGKVSVQGESPPSKTVCAISYLNSNPSRIINASSENRTIAREKAQFLSHFAGRKEYLLISLVSEYPCCMTLRRSLYYLLYLLYGVTEWIFNLLPLWKKRHYYTNTTQLVKRSDRLKSMWAT